LGRDGEQVGFHLPGSGLHEQFHGSVGPDGAVTEQAADDPLADQAAIHLELVLGEQVDHDVVIVACAKGDLGFFGIARLAPQWWWAWVAVFRRLLTRAASGIPEPNA